MPVSLLSLDFIITIVTLLVNAFLIFLVYHENRKALLNKIFVSLSLLMSLWLAILFIDGKIGPLVELARSSIFIATLMSLFFLFLAEVLPKSKFSMSKKWLDTSIISTVVGAVITLTPYAFEKVDIVEGVRKVVPGLGLLPFAMLSTFFSFLAVYLLVKKFIKSKGVERKQLGTVLWGISSMLTLVIVTILIPILVWENGFFISFAPAYVLIFLIMTALAIIRYQLFDIKVVITEFIVAVLVVVLIFEGLSSGSYSQIIYKLFFALLVTFLGTILVRSVKREIRQRQQVTRLAKSLERANLKLQELDRQKTEFLSIASHQLRTPLSIMKGYIELIEDGAYGKPTQKIVNTLDQMDESNERLVKLIDEFLDITRIEQGRTKFNFGILNLKKLIDSVVNELKGRAKGKGLKIIWKPEIKTIEVNVDEEKIRHVVFNFIDNAIKYSETGLIKVFMNKERNGIKVRVVDNGIGFGVGDQANFFQKFYRGNNVKGTNVTGTGLGIYVCKKFIENHKGRVWAKSSGKGKGSEFGFWIPTNIKVKADSKKKSA